MCVPRDGRGAIERVRRPALMGHRRRPKQKAKQQVRLPSLAYFRGVCAEAGAADSFLIVVYLCCIFVAASGALLGGNSRVSFECCSGRRHSADGGLFATLRQPMLGPSRPCLGRRRPTLDRIWSAFGRIRPKSADIGPISIDIGEAWPSSTKCWTISAKTTANLGTSLGRYRPNLRRW